MPVGLHQALNYACAEFRQISVEDVVELPAELLLELLGSEVRQPSSDRVRSRRMRVPGSGCEVSIPRTVSALTAAEQ